MKVVIAMDSFKGSISSKTAGSTVRDAVLSVFPDADVIVRPLADGGEGTAETMAEGLGGEMRTVTVTGPLGETVSAKYAMIGGTAVIEMAECAGLPLVPPDRRNPMQTTTFGVGQMIFDAIECGCREFIVGIGGSATNDGGIGMLTALGYEFLDAEGSPVGINGAALAKIASIDASRVDPRIAECVFHTACDVTNPLCGPRGAAAVYGPQKGATPDQVTELDAGLRNFAGAVKMHIGADFENMPGVGAAGGLGYALKVFLNSELRAGVDMILERTQFESYAAGADIVVTGEGRMDFQTAMGKAVVGVARAAKRCGAKVIAFAGSTTPDADEVNSKGVDAYFAIPRGVTTLEEAMDEENAKANLFSRAEQVFRLIKAVR